MSERGSFRELMSVILLVIVWASAVLGLGFMPVVIGAVVCAIIFILVDVKLPERKKLIPTKRLQKINFLIWPATAISVLVALYVTNYVLALAIVLTVILPIGVFLNDKYVQR